MQGKIIILVFLHIYSGVSHLCL